MPLVPGNSVFIGSIHNLYRTARESRDSKPTHMKIRCVIRVKPEVDILSTESSLSRDFARILD